MLIVEMLILAVIQGIAEFLPISSSGHLVIIGSLLGGGDDTATVEIILHAGTLASIFVIYWRRILALLRSDRRVIPLLIVGTIPAGILGLTIKTRAEWLLSNPLLAGCMLLVTGGLLWMLKWLPEGDGDYRQMRLRDALIIGCFQAFALLPGISRSGSTIVGARVLGLGRTDAVTFSFLLAIPAILGASVLAVGDLVREETSSQEVAVLVLGAVVSFAVGIAALRWLIRWAREGRLYWFAAWCIPVGLLVIAMYFAGQLS